MDACLAEVALQPRQRLRHAPSPAGDARPYRSQPNRQRVRPRADVMPSRSPSSARRNLCCPERPGGRAAPANQCQSIIATDGPRPTVLNAHVDQRTSEWGDRQTVDSNERRGDCVVSRREAPPRLADCTAPDYHLGRDGQEPTMGRCQSAAAEKWENTIPGREDRATACTRAN